MSSVSSVLSAIQTFIFVRIAEGTEDADYAEGTLVSSILISQVNMCAGPKISFSVFSVFSVLSAILTKRGKIFTHQPRCSFTFVFRIGYISAHVAITHRIYYSNNMLIRVVCQIISYLLYDTELL